ncbi:MAG: hypothetical protein DRZ90_11165, partial [Spirochaetes bacterium]
MKFKAVMILLILTSPIIGVFGDDSVIVGHINTEIEGKTHRNALLKELRIYEGKEFDSLAGLEYLVSSRANDLLRRRMFKEFTWYIDAENPKDIEIYIHIVDSFTLVPRPMLKFSTEKGLTLGMKLEYYNAFGTLTDQKFEGYWSPAEILFQVQVQNIILGPLHMDTSFKQFNGKTRYGNTDGTTLVEYRNSSSELFISLDIPLGPGSPWSYKITPLASWLYQYDSATIFSNEGFTPGLNHGFVTDQVDWVGNFRKGFYFDFMNNNLWYTGSGNSD